MKLLKNFILLSLISVLSFPVFSQISISPQGSYLKLFGGSDVSNFGFGLKAEYSVNNKTFAGLGFNYYLPYKEDGTTQAYALSNQMIPSSINVDMEYSVSFMMITLSAKRYFFSDGSSTVGFYGMAEMGLILAPVKSTVVEEYPESLYEVSAYEEGSETLQNFLINAGLGLEGYIGFGNVFIESKLCLPANEVNGKQVEITIPASLCTNVGIRFSFGNSGYGSSRGRYRGKN